MELLRLDHLPKEKKHELKRILTYFPNVLNLRGDKLPTTKKGYHYIPTTTDLPINVKPYRHTPERKKILKDHIEKDLAVGIIVPLTSSYLSQMFLIPKKSGKDGSK